VQEFIRKTLPSWKIVEVADLQKDDRRLWLANRAKGECPGVAIGHFFERGENAYAVLLHSRPQARARERLSVFRIRKDRIESHPLGDAPLEHDESLPVIWKAGPGKYRSFDGLKEIEITRDAIGYELIEAAANLYYWDGARFQELRISD
jgi:hypothetical protein